VKNETLLSIAIDYLRTVTHLSPEQLRGYLADWKLVPYFYRGQLAGCALMKGSEIHFVMRPEWRGVAFRRDSAHRFLKPLVAAHGGLTTRVQLNDELRHRFVTRIGFVETHRSSSFVFYGLDRAPFARK